MQQRQSSLIPGTQHNRFGMYLVLPEEGKSPIPSAATVSEISKLLAENKMRKRFGRVKLPKFKIESELALNAALQTMGMPTAFSLGANFSGISHIPAYISRVIHKAFIEVNEEGTEAAAVTAVESHAESACSYDFDFEFNADHPFLFLVRDNLTGVILFEGIVSDPT